MWLLKLCHFLKYIIYLSINQSINQSIRHFFKVICQYPNKICFQLGIEPGTFCTEARVSCQTLLIYSFFIFPQQDWEFLLSSSYHHEAASTLLGILGINSKGSKTAQPSLAQAQIDPSAPLFQYIPALAYALHLVYEVSIYVHMTCCFDSWSTHVGKLQI